jgi:hypothetical protein
MTRTVYRDKAMQRAEADGHRLACEDLAKTPRHMLGTGNPNHPDNDPKPTLFGYDVSEFMARQHK